MASFTGKCMVSYWLEVLRDEGIRPVPDGMLRAGLYGSKLLGRGSYGTCHKISVYEDSQYVSAVAKVTHEKSFSTNILREACMLQQLKGIKGVPRILGVSVDPPALVLTFHGPRTLLQVLTSDLPPTILLLKALEQVVSTLREIHSRCLVHNDIKVDNILVNFHEDGEVEATVIDLGCMTRVGEKPYCGFGIRHGDFPFLAPELASGGSASPASDVYSVGWILDKVGFMMNCQELRKVARLCLKVKAEHRSSLVYVHYQLRILLQRKE